MWSRRCRGDHLRSTSDPRGGIRICLRIIPPRRVDRTLFGRQTINHSNDRVAPQQQQFSVRVSRGRVSRVRSRKSSPACVPGGRPLGNVGGGRPRRATRVLSETSAAGVPGGGIRRSTKNVGREREESSQGARGPRARCGGRTESEDAGPPRGAKLRAVVRRGGWFCFRGKIVVVRKLFSAGYDLSRLSLCLAATLCTVFFVCQLAMLLCFSAVSSWDGYGRGHHDVYGVM